MEQRANSRYHGDIICLTNFVKRAAVSAIILFLRLVSHNRNARAVENWRLLRYRNIYIARAVVRGVFLNRDASSIMSSFARTVFVTHVSPSVTMRLQN